MKRKTKPPEAIVFPSSIPQQEVLDAIDHVVNVLAPSFVFGYYSLDDIKQEGRIGALKELWRYNPKLPLENFLYTVIRSRLINFKRNKFKRTDAPCRECHANRPCTNGTFCKKYTEWFNRNNTKANIMRPLDIDNISDEKERRTREESMALEKAATAELLERIDTQLPVELRTYYLQLRDGVAIPKAKRRVVEDAIREIIACQQNADH